jgi:pimeloyl-ACP methyl ester carboxylesterase
MEKASHGQFDLQEMPALARQTKDYWIDAFQRTILFWDVLRERSNRYFEHKAKVVPNVLHFEAELVESGLDHERPANYGLVRIKPPAGVKVNEKKRPFVVVDPRAGHGPGIGGFKPDSEIGMALRAGHPCYFIGFTPNPVPEQTIEDIMRAEAVFLEKVIELHPGAEGNPCVIGNCQAGWAIMMLAAARPELFGPIIAAGSPMSYWAGVEGKNPMRYSGGLLGGSWLAALTSDLGNGKFDGAWLVANFENLNPANTLWTKNYNVWARVDTEAERFLDFETYWGGHVNLNAAEIQWIVDQLFVGNRLATAEIITSDGIRLDLRNIHSPILCFCSEGDNITPPQQALGWIVDVYNHDNDIIACGQTIVYAIHESIGHLGIFVSGGVAKKEHEEFTSNIDLIDVLPFGIYEMILTPKTADCASADLVEGNWIARFERRTLDDVRAIVQPKDENELRFATVRRVSEINLSLYRLFMQPFVQALANEQTASWLQKLNPSSLPFELFSDRNPFMPPLAKMAEKARDNRHPSSPGNPLLQAQSMISDNIIAALDGWRDLRDLGVEFLFKAIYGSPFLQAAAGLWGSEQSPRRKPGVEPERIEFIKARIAELKSHIGDGGLVEAFIRSLVYIGLFGRGIDERDFRVLRRIRDRHATKTLQEFKETLRQQFCMLLLDQDAALAAIPAMLPGDIGTRAKAFGYIKEIAEADGIVTDEEAERLAQIEKLFGLEQTSKKDGKGNTGGKKR